MMRGAGRGGSSGASNVRGKPLLHSGATARPRLTLRSGSSTSTSTAGTQPQSQPSASGLSPPPRAQPPQARNANANANAASPTPRSTHQGISASIAQLADQSHLSAAAAASSTSASVPQAKSARKLPRTPLHSADSQNGSAMQHSKRAIPALALSYGSSRNGVAHVASPPPAVRSAASSSSALTSLRSPPILPRMSNDEIGQRLSPAAAVSHHGKEKKRKSIEPPDGDLFVLDAEQYDQQLRSKKHRAAVETEPPIFIAPSPTPEPEVEDGAALLSPPLVPAATADVLRVPLLQPISSMPSPIPQLPPMRQSDMQEYALQLPWRQKRNRASEPAASSSQMPSDVFSRAAVSVPLPPLKRAGPDTVMSPLTALTSKLDTASLQHASPVVTPQLLVDLTLDDDSPPPPLLLSPLCRSLPAAPARISMPAAAAIRSPPGRLTRHRRRSLDDARDGSGAAAASASHLGAASAAAASSRRSPTLSSSNAGSSDADAADDLDIPSAASSEQGERDAEDDDLDRIDLTGDDEFKAAPARAHASAPAAWHSRKRVNHYERKEAERESDLDSLSSNPSDDDGDDERIEKHRCNVHARPSKRAASEEDEESDADSDADSSEYPERDPRVNARLYQCSFLPPVMTEEQKARDIRFEHEQRYVMRFDPDRPHLAWDRPFPSEQDDELSSDDESAAEGVFVVRDIVCKRLRRNGGRKTKRLAQLEAAFTAASAAPDHISSRALLPWREEDESLFEYRVSWIGYGASEDSWEPYSGVRHVLQNWSFADRAAIPLEQIYMRLHPHAPTPRSDIENEHAGGRGQRRDDATNVHIDDPLEPMPAAAAASSSHHPDIDMIRGFAVLSSSQPFSPQTSGGSSAVAAQTRADRPLRADGHGHAGAAAAHAHGRLSSWLSDGGAAAAASASEAKEGRRVGAQRQGSGRHGGLHSISPDSSPSHSPSTRRRTRAPGRGGARAAGPAAAVARAMSPTPSHRKHNGRH